MKRFSEMNWEAIAGILAALAALILHLLHLIEEGLLLSIALVMLALLLLRDMRRESHEENFRASVERAEGAIKDMVSTLRAPEAVLIGPSDLVSSTERFVHRMRGEVVWFNICLQMFRPQKIFDTLFCPLVENPMVSSIRFISRHSEKELWENDILPKIGACTGNSKVQEPYWCELEGTVSFILGVADNEGREEALLSFWDEPFMSRTQGKQIPRYVFHVQSHSGLMARLKEIERSFRLAKQ